MSQPKGLGMGADLHFISQWEMNKISFLEGQGETGRVGPTRQVTDRAL